MIVLDASAVVELLLRTPRAAAIEERLFGVDDSLHAPHLLDVELAQVMRRYYLHGVVNAQRAGQVFADLADLPISRYAHEPLLTRVWQLRENLSAYDALYIALAEGLGAVFLTCDERLARAGAGRAQIEVPD